MEEISDIAIEIEGLSKKYDNFTLKDINLKVPRGCIVGFVGENGAGKTTVIKSILNLIQKENGTIRVFGKDHIACEKEIKEKTGVVFDESGFHDFLRLSDISKIMRKIYRKWDDKEFYKYCKKFSLPEKESFKNFSRGMKMKLSIAVALSHHAELLILDEATSGLDPVARDEILDIFLEFIQDPGHTIFVSSHIISDLEKVADYIAFIHKGELLFCRSKDELLYEYGIIHCTKEEYERLERTHVAGVRSNLFGVDVLVDNTAEVHRNNPSLTIEHTNLEEIILYIVRGEQK